MTRLVDRFGRTGFAALSSLMWALPMAAWAGSSDLSPIDKTAYPWIALTIGLVMLVLWIVLVSRLGRIPVTARQHRFDLNQMTRTEKRWTLATAAFFTGLVAWLNAAATVDWAPLTAAVGTGKTAPTLFAFGLAVYLVVMVAGLTFSWRKANAAFRARSRPYLNMSEGS
jgi:membrane protease YdiL (CAAX protease family)